MKISVKLNKNSSFNDEKHFFNCLLDLLEEWDDETIGLGTKECDKLDAGFDYDRFIELKTFLERKKLWLILIQFGTMWKLVFMAVQKVGVQEILATLTLTLVQVLNIQITL